MRRDTWCKAKLFLGIVQFFAFAACTHPATTVPTLDEYPRNYANAWAAPPPSALKNSKRCEDLPAPSSVSREELNGLIPKIVGSVSLSVGDLSRPVGKRFVSLSEARRMLDALVRFSLPGAGMGGNSVNLLSSDDDVDDLAELAGGYLLVDQSSDTPIQGKAFVTWAITLPNNEQLNAYHIAVYVMANDSNQGKQILVLDPILDQHAPMPLRSWVAASVSDVDTRKPVTLHLTAPDSWSLHPQTLRPTSSSSSFCEDIQTAYSNLRLRKRRYSYDCPVLKSVIVEKVEPAAVTFSGLFPSVGHGDTQNR